MYKMLKLHLICHLIQILLLLPQYLKLVGYHVLYLYGVLQSLQVFHEISVHGK